MTIRDFFDNATLKQSDRVAIRYLKKGALVERRYSGLRDDVLRLSSAIRSSGIVPGRDNVALILENCPEWPEIYLALVCCGITAVPVDPKLKEREMLFILSASGAKCVFAGEKVAQSLEAGKAELPALGRIVRVGSAPGGAPHELRMEADGLTGTFLEGVAGASGFDGLPMPEEDTVASLIYTSGTTGTPKGVILTHGNFASDTLAAVVPVKFCKDDNFLAILPFFHTYSFTGNILLPLSQGGCISFIRSIKTLGEDMKLLKPTILMAVPLLAEKIFAKVEKGVRCNPIARLLL